jgi:hypothetical protein
MSLSGTFRKCRDVRLESEMRTKADVRVLNLRVHALSFEPTAKTARFARAVFHFPRLRAYSPPPKRRDHHPARRGCAAAVDSDAGCGTGSGVGAEAEAAAGSGWLWLSGAAMSGWAFARKLTFSRTVERRRAAALSASCISVSVPGCDTSGAARSTVSFSGRASSNSW